MTTPKPAGRPPKDPSGAGRRFTVMLSPAQQQRALAFGGSVNFGVNEALRKSEELISALMVIVDATPGYGIDDEPTGTIDRIAKIARAALK